MLEFRRVLLAALLVGAFALVTVPTAQAISCTGTATAPTSCTGADPLPTTYSGNTPSDSLNGSPALAWLNYDQDSNTFTGVPGYNYNSFFTLTPTSDTTGTWTFDAAAALAGGLTLVPRMLAIKAADWWGFYAFSAGTFSGSWDTADGQLNQNGQPFNLSHLVFYDTANPNPGPGPVPLPSTLALFSSGMVLLCILSRRRKGKSQEFA